MPCGSDITKLNALRVLKELRKSTAGFGRPDGECDAHERQHQANRHHELHNKRSVAKTAHDHLVEQETNGWCNHQQGDDDRHQCGQPLFDCELPIAKGKKTTNCCMREIEDASRGIGDNKAAGGDGVNATKSNTNDKERRNRLCVD